MDRIETAIWRVSHPSLLFPFWLFGWVPCGSCWSWEFVGAALKFGAGSQRHCFPGFLVLLGFVACAAFLVFQVLVGGMAVDLELDSWGFGGGFGSGFLLGMCPRIWF